MSINQYLKPLTLKTDNRGILEIGGCNTVELAQKYGTPLYVLDERTLRKICQEYKAAFNSYDKVNMMFASKALCTSAVTAILAEEGFGFDTVSAGEIYTVLNTGADISKVIFNGNNKSSEELDFAVKSDVGRISVDNFSELYLLDKIAKSYNKTVKILLRVTPGIACHTHEYIQTGHLDSKFGFDLRQTDQAVELILDKYTNLKLYGLHAHIGSQIFETSVFYDEIEILVKEMARLNSKFNIRLNEINAGGGLGVKYTECDKPASVNEIADKITTSLKKSIAKYGTEEPVLFLEPGRSIVSTAGITLYTLGSCKQVPKGKKYFAVDGGMADNPRPAMYNAEYCAQIANKPDCNEVEEVTIAGRFCESGDILIKNIKLPQIETGDILCVFNTGAYNYSMASNYNRVPKPAMVLVNDGQSDLIIKRETLDDIISHDIIPDRLKIK